MDRIVVQYRYVDAASEAFYYICLIIIVAIIALFLPYLWIIVAVAAIILLPIQYSSDKKQQARRINNIPALVIDGYKLYYDRKIIDLSQMHDAKFNPDTDYDGNIMIFHKDGFSPLIEIYTDNMLIDRDELLRLILDRIDRAKELRH